MRAHRNHLLDELHPARVLVFTQLLPKRIYFRLKVPLALR